MDSSPGSWTPSVPQADQPFETLDAYGMVRWDPQTSALEYNEGVLPYTLNTPLFSDYTTKRRAVYLPPGESAGFVDEGVLEFPVGTVILKHFLLPADLRAPEDDLRLLETRVLIRQAEGWEQWPYTWAEDGSGAELDKGGEVLSLSTIDLEGAPLSFTYLVPQKNQCAECHLIADSPGDTAAEAHTVVPIGPTARNLNRDFGYTDGVANQLERWAELGLLADLPAVEDIGAATVDAADLDLETATPEQVEQAARDYLDINCAHCHRPEGVNGVSSQLFLNHDNQDPHSLGVCKKPGSAAGGTGGFTYDIVPGKPQESILIYRMETDDLGSIMPLLGRSLVHQEGNALVSQWIANMEPVPCE